MSIGKNETMRVSQVMLPLDRFPVIDEREILKEALDAMGRSRLGIACIVDLIVKELTTQGAMEPARLFESPYTDVAATGPDGLFAEGDVGKIVDILGAVRSTAVVAATG